MPEKVKTFEELSLHGLQDIYDAEHQALEKGLPALHEAATSAELKKAFKEHEAQTKKQVERLEKVFKAIGEKAERQECAAAKGLIEETQHIIKEGERGPVLDAALISAAQKFEHYEIASYGTARTFARQLGQEEAAKLLEETLAEEEQTDKKLTGLAESTINPKAEKKK